jgi:hypothetical protein
LFFLLIYCSSGAKGLTFTEYQRIKTFCNS